MSSSSSIVVRRTAHGLDVPHCDCLCAFSDEERQNGSEDSVYEQFLQQVGDLPSVSTLNTVYRQHWAKVTILKSVFLRNWHIMCIFAALMLVLVGLSCSVPAMQGP